MNFDEALLRVQEDPDFVYLKRYDYSLKKLLVRYPEGVPNHIIAQGLMMTEEDLATMWEGIIAKLRKNF